MSVHWAGSVSSGSYRRTLLYVYHTSETRAAAYGEASRFTSRMRCSLLLRKKGICGVAGCFKMGFVPPPLLLLLLLCGQWTIPFLGEKGRAAFVPTWKRAAASMGEAYRTWAHCYVVCVRFVAQRQSPCTVVLVEWWYLQPNSSPLSLNEKEGRCVVVSTLFSGRRLSAPGNGRWFV